MYGDCIGSIEYHLVFGLFLTAAPVLYKLTMIDGTEVMLGDLVTRSDP